MNPQQLGILRLAVFGGVLLFGIVAIFVTASGNAPPANPDLVALTRMIAYGSIPPVCIALFVVRMARARAAASGRPALTLAGWAIAEVSGLLGALLIYFGGEIWAWLAGLAVMLVSWQLLPADPGVE